MSTSLKMLKFLSSRICINFGHFLNLKAGAHVDVVNNRGLTPIQCATTNVSEIILKSQVRPTKLSYDKCRIGQVELQKCRNIE